MALHIDNASFKVMQTDLLNVFAVTFDYTKSDFDNGWEAEWQTVTIRINSLDPSTINDKALEAIAAHEQSSEAATLEAWLAANKGETVVRVDPNATDYTTLLNAVEATGPSDPVNAQDRNSFSIEITGTASVDIEGSIDGTLWHVLDTVTETDISLLVDWTPFMRANVTALTDGAVTVIWRGR
jgi:hypothetical protein